MKTRPQQTITALALALALSGVLVSGAQAARPDNRPGILGIGPQSTDVSHVFTWAADRPLRVQAVRPDDRAELRGVGVTLKSTSVALSQVFERAVLQHNAPAAPRPDNRAGLRGVGTALAGLPR
jgi:hypothetical protein